MHTLKALNHWNEYCANEESMRAFRMNLLLSAESAYADMNAACMINGRYNPNEYRLGRIADENNNDYTVAREVIYLWDHHIPLPTPSSILYWAMMCEPLPFYRHANFNNTAYLPASTPMSMWSQTPTSNHTGFDIDGEYIGFSRYSLPPNTDQATLFPSHGSAYAKGWNNSYYGSNIYAESWPFRITTVHDERYNRQQHAEMTRLFEFNGLSHVYNLNRDTWITNPIQVTEWEEDNVLLAMKLRQLLLPGLENHHDLAPGLLKSPNALVVGQHFHATLDYTVGLPVEDKHLIHESDRNTIRPARQEFCPYEGFIYENEEHDMNRLNMRLMPRRFFGWTNHKAMIKWMQVYNILTRSHGGLMLNEFDLSFWRGRREIDESRRIELLCDGELIRAQTAKTKGDIAKEALAKFESGELKI